ncbi:MAG TPA: glycosyltransferase family 39 protein, partial [Anaerolineae bacterium]|nr:glycosyltransferase family 39 protein [Anaerolineae bacterium]
MARTFYLPRLGLILVVFVVLAAIYSVATPIFEASDEVSHYAVVQHIADTGELPVQQQSVKTVWEQEGSQPPLYYWLVSPVARLIDTSDAAERMSRNPHAIPGNPSLEANRNLIIHSPAEDFPWHNTTLAVHLIRFISIVLGAGTVALSYLLARRLFPDRASIPIGTAALIAFNPMFLFISASVNNDNLTILLTSLALYLSVVCWYEPPGRVDRSGWGRRLLLGSVLGAAALSKISGLTLLPIVALILTVRHLRQRDGRGWILSGVLVALPVLFIAGWWYWRNLTLYGELFGLDMMVAIAGQRSMSLLDLVPEFDGFRYSYWALFGAVNIVTFSLAYFIFDLFMLLAVIGGGLWFIRNRRSDRIGLMAILVGYVLLVFVGVIRWTMMTPASQGRLMFPAMAAISLLLWLGWEAILGFALRTFGGFWTLDFMKLRWAMPLFMLIVAVIVPFRDLAPTYAGPQMIGEKDLPSDLKRLEVDYGDRLRLIGYRLAEPRARSDSAEFTLYWQCLKPITADYSVFAIVYGRQWQEVGKRDAYPYHGLYATRQCEAGQVFADPYRIPIKPDGAERPSILRVQIGLKDWATHTELAPAVHGQAVPSVMLDVGKLA